MIALIKSGHYKLISTKIGLKILCLDNQSYIWLHAKGIGEILVYSHRKHSPHEILNSARYRIYAVKDEEHVTDLLHLELEVGDGIWQGYLLLSGLPTRLKKRARIIATSEQITDNESFPTILNKLHMIEDHNDASLHGFCHWSQDLVDDTESDRQRVTTLR